jgi:hypothetical protein
LGFIVNRAAARRDEAGSDGDPEPARAWSDAASFVELSDERFSVWSWLANDERPGSSDIVPEIVADMKNRNISVDGE